MKNTIFQKVLIGTLLLSSYIGVSQSNPTPFNLETGGTYNFTNWPATSPASTYPNNMIFHIMANVNPTLSSVASGNVTGIYNDVSTKTRMNGLGTGGFSFRNSSATPDIIGYTSNRLGEAVLGINTTNRTNVQVSFKAGEIGLNTVIYAITCKYRIGTSGAYLNLPGASTLWEYRSDNPSSSISFAPITLPAACDNQSVIQIRWAYNYISGTSTLKPELFVDDISITSIPLVSISPLPNTCISAPSFLLTDGQPAGGIYSGVGVVGSNFDPAIAGSGIQTITYTYADINGFSNSASTTIDVNSTYCITTTTLKPTSCGVTGLSLSSYINCEPVLGATDYEFQFVNTSLGYTQSAFRGTGLSNIRLLGVSGLQYGQTYDVKVRAKVGGAWGVFGAICQITLMPFVATSLTTAYCGATGLSISSYIYCNAIAGTTDYEFTISNSTLGYSQVRTRATFAAIKLTSYSGLIYGETYDVTVRSKVAGIWSPLGASCQITLMPSPSTSLTSTYCGATNLMLSNYIYCNQVPGSSDYEFTISNTSLGYSQVKTRALYSAILLNSFTGLLPSTTYDVTVRTKVSGVWGPTGPVCSITLSGTPDFLGQNLEDIKQMAFSDEISSDTFINIYPNPINQNNNLKVDLKESQSIAVIVSDMMGRTIFEKNYSNVSSFEIPMSELKINVGIYSISLNNGENIQTRKFIVSE